MTDYNKVVNYENKVEVIKEEMQEFIAFISEQLKTEKRKDLNIQHRLGMKIMQVLRKWRTLDEHDVEKMEADTLYEIYMGYLELIVWVNQVIAYTPTKLEFCSFACITVGDYNKLMTCKNLDMRRVMKSIDSDLINAAEISAENGVTKEKMTTFRLKSKESGHEVKEVSRFEEAMQDIQEIAGALYYERKLKSITSNAEKNKK